MMFDTSICHLLNNQKRNERTVDQKDIDAHDFRYTFVIVTNLNLSFVLRHTAELQKVDSRIFAFVGNCYFPP